MLERRAISEKPGLAGLAIALVLGSVSAALLAWPYQFVVDLIPLIYIKFFVTIGFGIGVGFVVGVIAKKAKGHGKMAVGIVSVLAALTGEVVSFKWAYDRETSKSLAPLNEEIVKAGNAPITLDQFREKYSMSDYIDDRVESGFVVGRLASHKEGEAPMSGGIVWFVWLAEAGILGFFAWKTARPHVDQIFCEACNRWAEPWVAGKVDGVSMTSLSSAVKRSDLSALIAPELADTSRRTALYVVYECDGCESCWLTVSVAWTQRTEKGKLVTMTKDIASGVVLPVAIVESLAKGVKSRPAAPDAAPEPV